MEREGVNLVRARLRRVDDFQPVRVVRARRLLRVDRSADVFRWPAELGTPVAAGVLSPAGAPGTGLDQVLHGFGIQVEDQHGESALQDVPGHGIAHVSYPDEAYGQSHRAPPRSLTVKFADFVAWGE
jgi:hypothetical protein